MCIRDRSITARVRGVTAFSKSSARSENPSSARVRTATGTPWAIVIVGALLPVALIDGIKVILARTRRSSALSRDERDGRT